MILLLDIPMAILQRVLIIDVSDGSTSLPLATLPLRAITARVITAPSISNIQNLKIHLLKLIYVMLMLD
jgi:hypothetical protein